MTDTEATQQGTETERIVVNNFVAVRYGYDKLVSGFRFRRMDLRRGQQVVVSTDRGVELGTVLRRFDGEIPKSLGVKVLGKVVRIATAEDGERQKEIEEVKQIAEFKTVHQLIEKHKLPMKLVKVEHLFGGEKVIFFFMADGRVDFRELVKDVARTFRTRIEMRQIGARDEAKLLGLCEMCGEELCCKKHLRSLEPVTMSMAKNQLKGLDPVRLTGRCGRLRCCLAYEDSMYTKLKKELPAMGTVVPSDAGDLKVVEQIPLTGEVRLMNEHRVRTVLSAEDVRRMIAEEKENPRPKKPVQTRTKTATRRPTKKTASKTKATTTAPKQSETEKDAPKDEKKPKRNQRRRRRRGGGKGNTQNKDKSQDNKKPDAK